jgi:ATP-dependent DNA helicase PIF1
VKGFGGGAKWKTFTDAEAAETFMNVPSVVGCYKQTHCSYCFSALGSYTRAAICSACAIGQVSNIHSLCDQQIDILRLVSRGQNIFFTGGAGTGKPTTLKSSTRLLDRVARKHSACPPTGIAALLLSGTTVHVFAGWNFKAAEELSIGEMESNAWKDKNRDRFQEMDVLIIDEISVIQNFISSRLDRTLRAVRKRGLPFGGVQLIVSCDFHQLPPVRPFRTCLDFGKTLEGWKEKTAVFACPRHGSWHDHEKWAFAAVAWSTCHFACRQLTSIHRQQDADFARMLNQLRQGKLAWENEILLIDHEIDFDPWDAVQLYPLRSKVDGINESEFDQLPGPARTYTFLD